MNDRQQQLNQALEAMFFGFKTLVKKPDQDLAERGYSRIHHRILYFVGRHPRCSINELLGILGVSKQYLNRPLKRLLQDGFVESQIDAHDQRIRRLSLSNEGKSFEQQLSGQQRERFARVFEQVGSEAEQHWREVMKLLAEEE
jgi:DNA-binding MarR family transcriptional regulator